MLGWTLAENPRFPDGRCAWRRPCRSCRSFLAGCLGTDRENGFAGGTGCSATLSVQCYRQAVQCVGHRQIPRVRTGQGPRNSQTRSAEGANLNSSKSSRVRSRCEELASSLEFSPACSSRRKMLLASARASFGPARKPSRSADSARSPSGAESTRAATSTDASTTIVTSGRCHGRVECWTGPRGSRPLPSGREPFPATLREKAGTRSLPIHSGGTPAWIGAALPHEP